MKRPLEGIRVLAIEQFGAGPYGSMCLADLGAEVIKIENRRLGGDAARHTGEHRYGNDDSPYFQAFNLNKKSVTLNLKNEEAKPLLHALVASSDVVWNNLRGNQAARLGLDYASLEDVKPQIVCSHISAYGRDNDRADWPGYDYLMQAECGYLHLTGEPDGPPTRFGLSIVDFMTGVVAGMATLAALIGRDKNGGCDVDISLFDVALHQLTYPGTWYMNHGTRTGRVARGGHPSNTPVQLFTTADGWIFVMCMTEKFWDLMLETLGREDVGQDPRFASMPERTRHRVELTALLDELFSQDTTDNWIRKLQTRVPVAPVYDLPHALDNPFVETVGMIQHMPHPHVDTLKVLRSPVKLAGHRLDGQPGHGLGADNDAILGEELGFSDQLDALRAKDVI